MHEGSLCVPGAAGRRPAGPACGDLGPELCTGQSRGRHGVQRHDFVLRSPPRLHLAPGASSKFCLAFLLSGLPWARQPPPCMWGFRTEPSGPGRKVDEHFLSIFHPGEPPRALRLPSLSRGRSTLNGS